MAGDSTGGQEEISVIMSTDRAEMDWHMHITVNVIIPVEDNIYYSNILQPRRQNEPRRPDNQPEEKRNIHFIIRNSFNTQSLD